MVLGLQLRERVVGDMFSESSQSPRVGEVVDTVGDLNSSLNQSHKPKLSFFGFCTILTLVAMLALGILLVSATVAYAVGKSIHSKAKVNSPAAVSTAITDPGSAPSVNDSNLQTFNGMMTDSYCGARHSKDSNRSSAECTRYCIKHGAKFSLIGVNSRREVQGATELLEKFAGQRVNIAGTLQGDAITASSIQLAD